MKRFVVTLDVLVEAPSEDEASEFIRQVLTGRFDVDITGVFEEGPEGGQISWDALDPRRH